MDVCALSGRLPGPSCPPREDQTLRRGTEPSQPCPFHADVKLDRRTGLLAGPACPAAVIDTRPMLALPEVYASWARRQRL